MTAESLSIRVTGVVQGVGFRPFVYNLAAFLGLVGWVRNTSAGVEIQVEGGADPLQKFVAALRTSAPPLARIDSLEVQNCPANGYTKFEILPSSSIPEAFQPVSPDVATCPDCLKELFDPADRRYRYPFTNCTNCGPRFTIIQDIPYDRPKTTMAGFSLCPQCAAEYENPADRRFHAQPVACPACGPHIWLEITVPTTGIPGTSHSARRTSHISSDSVILDAQRMLREGKIVAIKGLGGFHLACDALNPSAVAELRRRKLRVDKPFALMMPDLAAVASQCYFSAEESELLASPARPIVILPRRLESTIAGQMAPGQNSIGVMLPYTPLHHLLFAANPLSPSEAPPQALVMTSGNLSEEPIATENDEALERLGSLADAFLMHDRPIRTRCDDSVLRVVPKINARDKEVVQLPDTVQPGPGAPSRTSHDTGTRDTFPLPIRRSRGYAPYPVRLPWETFPLLAAGAELKNTFCLTRGRYAFLSHHIGDMENFETLQSFEDSLAHYTRLFRVEPQAVVYDLHPNYLATRYALEMSERLGLAAIGAQHHHAHIAACMAEHGLRGDQPVLGIAFDGTGYGDDGAIWGGEFLLAGYRTYQRAAHLAYVPLPGGDAATRRPARAALAHLWQAGIDWPEQLLPVKSLCAEERHALRSQLEHHINSPLTSSMGRLFDAAAALAGGRQQVNYEAQAAIEFEAMADPDECRAYPFEYETPSGEGALVISPVPLFGAMLEDVQAGTPASIQSARFHNGVAEMVLHVTRTLCRQWGVSQVILSGGVWQNCTLLAKTLSLLRQEPLTVYTHQQVPPNDGGLSLGQAVIGLHALQS